MTAITYDPNNQLVVSEREILVSIIYGVDMFVDREDLTVSAAIKTIGTW